MKKIKKDFTNGSITKTIILLAIPLILSNIFITLYQIIDTYWVGQLGKEALAGVSISFPILFLINSIIMGLTIAGTILVSQYKGKKDFKSIDFVATQTIILVTMLSLIITIIGMFFSSTIIALFGAENIVAIIATEYLFISFIGVIFNFLFLAVTSLLRGIGEVKIPMYIIIGTVILNFILDPIFIFGFGIVPAFGVNGAAITTILTQFLSAILALILIFSGKLEIHVKWCCLKPDKKMIFKLFKIGFPASIEFIARSLSMLLMTYIVAWFGTIAIASFGLGTRIFSFVLIPSFGFSLAVSTIVGQNVGAQRFSRIKETIRKGTIISFTTLSVLAFFLTIFAKQIALAFIPNETLVLKETILLLQLMATSFALMGIQFTLFGAMRGAGATKKVMELSIMLGIIQLVNAFIFSIWFGLIGIWFSYPVSMIIGIIITIFYYKKMDWKKNVLTH
ncbi:MAG: MATE family efflux transporter [Candidatus ainarchaeum sp.]|nr:MATE family efflux transporter [Candidatus ainarchaeum sp.]